MNPKVINAFADHTWLVLLAISVAAKGLEPAFPHALATCDAISATAFQLALLASNPMAALKTLRPMMTTTTPTTITTVTPNA
jgi:hypothetical protein